MFQFEYLILADGLIDFITKQTYFRNGLQITDCSFTDCGGCGIEVATVLTAVCTKSVFGCSG